MWAGPGADILCLACLLLQVQAWDAFASGRSLRAIAEDPARLRPLKHATVVGYVVDCALFAAFGTATVSIRVPLGDHSPTVPS